MDNGIFVITHRGLEPSNLDFYPESSYEAFSDQLKRGFGIEFDPNFCKDGIVVFHDATLKRISQGNDERKFCDLSLSDIKKISLGNAKKGRIPALSEVLALIEKSKTQINAMHIKGKFQEKEKISGLLNELNKYPKAIEKLIIFDVKPEIARYIKSINKKIQLAPSIAHEFDIKRYNDVVLGTLISIEGAIKYKKEGIYDWVWLDEWDTLDENGKEKQLYTKDVFSILKKEGYKISLVTPELHGTSPGLLGGEAHKDAKDKDSLFKRIKDILQLRPDALCTDYPEEVKEMLKN